MAQEVIRQTSNSSACTWEWRTWPTASTECASREVSGGFSAGQASRPPVLGIQEVGGKRAEPERRVWLMADSLPVGWTWSLCFAQKANLRRKSSVGLLSKSVLLTDRGQSVVLKPRSKGVIPLRLRGQLRDTILGGASCEGMP